jgi:hypothetical protein
LNAIVSSEERAALMAPATKPKRRKSSVSPTQRTLKFLRQRGAELVQVVEHWNPHARVRQDLFGIIDVIAIARYGTDEATVIGIQTCRSADVADRVKKIADSDALPILQRAGVKVLVWGWRKNSKGRWVLREVDLS